MQIHEGDASPYRRTGSLYTLTAAAAGATHAEGWNTMQITLAGPRTRVHVNGTLVTDYTEGEPVPPRERPTDPVRGPRPAAGYIGLQNHPQGGGVRYREVSVHPLR